MAVNRFIEERLNRIENTQAKQIEQIAELSGAMKVNNDALETIRLTLEKITTSKPGGGNDLLQKALLGAIVVQSLLSGLTTPELAKQIIHQLFSGGSQ